MLVGKIDGWQVLRADIDSANDNDAADDVTAEDDKEEILFGNCYPFLAIARQYLSIITQHRTNTICQVLFAVCS